MNDKLKTFEDEMERERFEKNLAEVQGTRQAEEEAELESELGDHLAETGSEMSELAKRVAGLAQKVLCRLESWRGFALDWGCVRLWRACPSMHCSRCVGSEYASLCVLFSSFTRWTNTRIR